jgi:hypothetical protein
VIDDALLGNQSHPDMSTLEIVEARGDHFLCGRDYGAATKRNIIWRLDNFIDDGEFKHSSQALHAAHESCKQYFPQYLRELQGVADGAEVDFWKLLYFNLPELSDSDSGCSSIAIREGNETLLVHNEDGVGEEPLQNGFRTLRPADCVLLRVCLCRGVARRQLRVEHPRRFFYMQLLISGVRRRIAGQSCTDVCSSPAHGSHRYR